MPLARLCLALIVVCLVYQYETRAAESYGEGQSEQTTANQNLSTSQLQSTLVQANIRQSEPAPAEWEHQRKQENAESNAGKPLTQAESFTLVLNVLALLVIAFQAAIYLRQLNVMRELKAISERQSSTLDNQATAMQHGLAETQKIVEQNERTVIVAERSVEVAQETMVYAQRAYISIPKISAWLEEEMGVFKLIIENSGNSPANNVQMLAVAEIKEHPPIPDINSGSWTQIGLIVRTGEFEKHVVTKKITPEQRQLVSSGDLKLYCWGIIRYQDIFKQSRGTKFCFVWRKASMQASPCKTGNEAD
ncbi:MAG TPA: hypothetical protein VM934_08205 [Pyrinomonadaceae bacterium]|jgi:hypothetical protein|nr:hypothetical protein [Pyrinomonadaceae bacterium]